MEQTKEKYVETFGKPKAAKQGDDLSWEEYLAHELFRTSKLLDWYEQRDYENDMNDSCCGGQCGCSNCGTNV